MENPTAIEGTGLEKKAAFVAAFRYLKNRISIFMNLLLRPNFVVACNFLGPASGLRPKFGRMALSALTVATLTKRRLASLKTRRTVPACGSVTSSASSSHARLAPYSKAPKYRFSNTGSLERLASQPKGRDKSLRAADGEWSDLRSQWAYGRASHAGIRIARNGDERIRKTFAVSTPYRVILRSGAN